MTSPAPHALVQGMPGDDGPRASGGPEQSPAGRELRRARRRIRQAWPFLRFALGIGGAALVVWVLSSHTDELSGISSVFDHLSWGWLVPAVAAEGASYVTFALMERRLLAVGGLDTSVRTLSVLTLSSQAILNSVPGGAAVAAVYGFRWFRRLGANDSLAAWSMVASMVVAVLSLAVVAAGGLALAAGEGASLDLVPVTIGVLAVTIALGALFLYHRPQLAVASWLLRTSRRLTGRQLGELEARMARFMARVAEFRPSAGEVSRIVGFGVGNWVFDCACFAFSFLAVGAGIPWKGLLLSYGAGQLAANLPITPGGLGVVEGSITIALVAFGGSRVSTVEAVLIYRLISFWSELVVGWLAAGWLAYGVRSGRWSRRVHGEQPVPAPAIEMAAMEAIGGGEGNR